MNMEAISDSIEYRGGIGFCGLLVVLFIGLKLTGYVTWSWWWVLAPLWIPWAIVLSIVLNALLLTFLVALVTR